DPGAVVCNERIPLNRSAHESSRCAILEPMDDTSPAAQARYYELLRRQSPMDRLRTAGLLTRMVRELAEADILRANPGASRRELQFGLASRLYGDEVAQRLFPRTTD